MNAFGEVFRESLEKVGQEDCKTRLQEWLQQEGPVRIEYVVDREEGPPHDKTFYVSLMVNGQLWGAGRGKSKKEAEQSAAGAGLKRGGSKCTLNE